MSSTKEQERLCVASNMNKPEEQVLLYKENPKYRRKLAIDVMPEEKMALRLMFEANRGHGMAGLKEWLQQRFGSLDSALPGAPSETKNTAMRSVITPDTIPEFVIPFSISSSSSRASLVDPDGSVKEAAHRKVTASQSCPANRLTRSDSTYPKVTLQHQQVGLHATTQVNKKQRQEDKKDAEECRHVTQNLDTLTVSSVYQNGTNEDPGSAAAVSLPHLRTNTSFGFTTVKESPHTRRKESLLLGSVSMGNLHNFKLSSPQLRFPKQSQTSLLDRFSASQYHGHALPFVGLSATSSKNSLFSENDSVMSEDHSESPAEKIPSRARVYNRRRSSVPTIKKFEDERDELVDFEEKSMSRHDSHELAVLGEMKLSIIYNKAKKNLTLSIIKAEKLARDLHERNQLNISLRACMLPEKKPRYDSKLVKGSHNPHFDEHFVFKHLTVEEMEQRAIRLRVYNKRATMSNQELLGEIILPLGSLGLAHGEEVRMWRDLEPQSLSQQNLGYINVSLKFEPKEDRLQVSVMEAKGLPRNLTGQPDSYICVIISQPGREVMKKQTRICKSAINPVFKEIFKFPISPKVDDLRYTTVHLLVMNHEVLRNDQVIGQIKLGHDSTGEGEYEHWLRTMDNAYKDTQQRHYLVGCKSLY